MEESFLLVAIDLGLCPYRAISRSVMVIVSVPEISKTIFAASLSRNRQSFLSSKEDDILEVAKVFATGPSTIKSFETHDLATGKPLGKPSRFRSESIRIIIRGLAPKSVETTAKTIIDVLEDDGLKYQGPVCHKKYRGKFTVRPQRESHQCTTLENSIIHTREIRIPIVTQDLINKMISISCPLSVEIQIRKGINNKDNA